MEYRTKYYTPLFNKEDFLFHLDYSPVDHTNHMRILETLLLPKRKVEILEVNKQVCKVRSRDYLNKEFYTLKSFVEEGEEEPKKPLPSIEKILLDLWNFPKMPYLLGGTSLESVDLGLSDIDPFKARHKCLYGIDCSGLLYHVTNGHTPRNTSDMFDYGTKVSSLKPLDLILFPGHVLIYLGEDKVIESREVDGVVISDWSRRQKQLKKKLTFIRFHPQAF